MIDTKQTPKQSLIIFLLGVELILDPQRHRKIPAKQCCCLLYLSGYLSRDVYLDLIACCYRNRTLFDLVHRRFVAQDGEGIRINFSVSLQFPKKEFQQANSALVYSLITPGLTPS